MIKEGTIQIPFRYAAGELGSLFLEALREEKKILGSPCPSCKRMIVPARSFCPFCFEKTASPIEVGPQGRIVSWTQVPGQGTYGLILLDGSDTGMLHLLIGDAGKFSYGSRVKPRFAEKRIGSILDIEGFELLEI